MHLAQAFEVPGASIFGGGADWPAYAPWAAGSIGICNPLPCFGCRWDCFAGHAICVETIPVSQVIEALCAACAAPRDPPRNVLLQAVGVPLLGLITDASARYQESARNLSERLDVITELDISQRRWTIREKDLLTQLADAEASAAERLSVLVEVHEEAARRLDVIHDINREAEARLERVNALAGALAQNETAREVHQSVTGGQESPLFTLNGGAVPIRACQIGFLPGSGNIGDELMTRAFWSVLPSGIALDVAVFPERARQRQPYPPRHRYGPVDWEGNESLAARDMPGLLVGDTPVADAEGLHFHLVFWLRG